MIYYNWTDIEKFLSEAMGITDGSFSRKKSTGNFGYWLLWVYLTGDKVCDSYEITPLNEEVLKEYRQKIIDTYVDWDGDETILEFIDALKKLREVVGKEIVIYYWW